MTCPVGNDVHHASALLRQGGIVAFPTETVYGLGARVLDVHAVARVFEAKGRPHFDPLIVHLGDAAELDRWTTGLTPQGRTLAETFWPGPLTLVLPKTPAVPDLVTAGLPSVALRVPQHPLALQLIAETGCPVAAPSANLFGRVSPTTAAHVSDQLGGQVDYILEGGPCRVGIESTVIDLTTSPPRLLRPGGASIEELEGVLGPLQRATAHASNGPQPSPGLLDRHYAPLTPLRIVAGLPPEPPDNCGLLLPIPQSGSARFAAVEVLSETGDLREAAAGFYAALRRLDDCQLDLILAIGFPDERLGTALNDRLQRAAAR